LALPLAFPRRAYHPPQGPVNCLLSLGYSILYHRLAECLLALQINPWEGIFHEARGMHMALASDLIEPFRFLVDRIVLSMIHNKQISAEDFVHNEYSSYERLSSAAMRKYIHRFEFTMRNEVKIGNEVLNWALAMDRSAGKLLQSLRLGIDFMANRIA
jgi:CRISPR-associated endonuclease Cas1